MMKICFGISNFMKGTASAVSFFLLSILDIGAMHLLKSDTSYSIFETMQKGNEFLPFPIIPILHIEDISLCRKYKESI